MTVSPSRPEARGLFGSQSASELGAPVASSTPEQLPGHEPASARKGYEDAIGLRNRCVEGSFGHEVLPEQQCFSVHNDAAGWAELVERLRGLSISAIIRTRRDASLACGRPAGTPGQ